MSPRWWTVCVAMTLPLALSACPQTEPPVLEEPDSALQPDPEPLPTPLETALGLTVTELLETQHVTGGKLNAKRRADALALYIEHNDPEKMLLLAEDVAAIRAAGADPEELRSGRFTAVEEAMRFVPGRLAQARQRVKRLLSAPLDLDSNDTFETNPSKRRFCSNEAELDVRWRKVLTLNVLETMAVEGVDQAIAERAVAEAWQRKLAGQATRAEQLDLFVNALAGAFDPHTTYLAPQRKAQFDAEMSGSVVGIGVELEPRAGVIVVANVLAGSPATGKLEVGDQVLRVTSHDGTVATVSSFANDRVLRHVLSVLWGPKDTEVIVRIKRGKAKRDVKLVRKLVSYGDTFARAAVVTPKKKGRSVGYLRMPRFYGDTRNDGEQVTDRRSAADVARLLTKLKKARVSGVVLDLRDNVGGFLEDAANIAGLFMPAGPVAQIRSTGGSVEQLTTPKRVNVLWSGPLVVLVNHKTASSAEVLAAVLQDRRRALIVGTSTTFGKGTIQRVAPLAKMLDDAPADVANKLGVLKITRHVVFRITGVGIQRRGVTPDVLLPDFALHPDGERELPTALPWARIDPVEFTPVGDPKRFASVRSQSKRWREADDATWGAMSRRLALLKASRTDSVWPLARETWQARRNEHLAGVKATQVAPVERLKVTPLPTEPPRSWVALGRDLWVDEATVICGAIDL